tara:strand:- start:6585 stop:7670 length:1086 start_codon:yes stop_codon:yes gene_type:complete
MRIKQLKSIIVKKKLKVPRKNSFGTQKFRSGFFVKLTEQNGVEGYGEGFCNWPNFSADYRDKYINDLFKPLIQNFEFSNPEHLYFYLNNQTEKIKIQSGDFGAINHCLAAIDLAAWDLFSKLKKKPLRNILYKKPNSEIPLYASGLTKENFNKFYPNIKKFKINHIKIKVGFKEEEDLNFLKIISKLDFKTIMVDANQAWSEIEAIKRIRKLEKINKLYWVEEPIMANCNVKSWLKLKRKISSCIAAGENHYGETNIINYLNKKCFDFYQPDVTKYGGITSFINIYKKNKKKIKYITPHYLGSGPGLFASAHLVSGISNVPLEFDVTENRIRDTIFKKNLKIKNGNLILNNKPGIGIKLKF